MQWLFFFLGYGSVSQLDMWTAFLSRSSFEKPSPSGTIKIYIACSWFLNRFSRIRSGAILLRRKSEARMMNNRISSPWNKRDDRANSGPQPSAQTPKPVPRSGGKHGRNRERERLTLMDNVGLKSSKSGTVGWWKCGGCGYCHALLPGTISPAERRDRRRISDDHRRYETQRSHLFGCQGNGPFRRHWEHVQWQCLTLSTRFYELWPWQLWWTVKPSTTSFFVFLLI